ncbi:MAG: phage integrase SAM-like domain-containing protein [Bacteroidales bacterium]|nr:phage integrase SAM-like domain-containing protein [Bacteroidales bacterium]
MATGNTEESLSINAELAAFKAGIMEQHGKCKPENLTITLIGSILKGTHVAEEDRPRMVTLVDFALEYLESRFLKKQITYQTYYNHRSYLRVFSDFERFHTGGKSMTLMKLNPETFEAFIQYRMEWRHNKHHRRGGEEADGDVKRHVLFSGGRDKSLCALIIETLMYFFSPKNQDKVQKAHTFS